MPCLDIAITMNIEEAFTANDVKPTTNEAYRLVYGTKRGVLFLVQESADGKFLVSAHAKNTSKFDGELRVVCNDVNAVTEFISSHVS